MSAALLARRASVGARHRAPVRARTSGYGHDFIPRHCAGETCMHDHPDADRAQQLDAAGQPGRAAFARARRQLESASD